MKQNAIHEETTSSGPIEGESAAVSEYRARRQAAEHLRAGQAAGPAANWRALALRFGLDRDDCVFQPTGHGVPSTVEAQAAVVTKLREEGVAIEWDAPKEQVGLAREVYLYKTLPKYEKALRELIASGIAATYATTKLGRDPAWANFFTLVSGYGTNGPMVKPGLFCT